MSKMRIILVQEKSISVDENDYISLTDMAKCLNENSLPEKMIASWLGIFRTLQFLDLWEKMHNEAFNIEEMKIILLEASENKMKLSPKEYQKRTAAIGIISRLDCNGDIFAHKDIALYFSYLSLPEFQVYLIKGFQKLKEEEIKILESNRTWHPSIVDYVNNPQTLLKAISGQNNIFKKDKK